VEGPVHNRHECGPDAQRLEGDRGSNLVEYSMLLALIVIACLGALSFFASTATGKMSCVSSAIVGQVSGVTC
jgi:Flp pilus assembly pilin Flp